jgi:hypothetical protein
MPRGTTGTGRLLPLAAALVVIAVVGCGGGGGSANTATSAANIQAYGVEAGKSDRGAVAAALRGYLDARADGHWARSCYYTASRIRQELKQVTSQSPLLKGADCAKIIGTLSGGVPVKVRTESTAAAILSVRIKDGSAYVIYRSAGGIKYIPMVRESSGWKVGSLAGSRLS